MKKTTKQKLARYITPFMHKILTTFSFVLLTVAFSSSFANTDTTTISNFYQLKLEVEKLKFMQAQHKPNNYTPQIQALENQLNQLIQALENQLNQLKNNFNVNNTDVNRQFTHSKELIIRQDERIVDFNSHLFWSGILVTALLVLISVGGYFFSSIQAKKEIDAWLTKHADKQLVPFLNEQLELFKKQLERQETEFQNQKRLNAQGFNSTDKQQNELNQLAEQIKKKPSSQCDFADFFTLHLDSYYQGNFKQSLEHANQALKITPITDKQEAKVLLHKGSLLEILPEPEPDKAIETFNLVIEKFKNKTETTLLKRVAQALMKKGTALNGLGESQKAIDTFDLVIEKFKNKTETTLLEEVAIALSQKGTVLSNKGEPNKAIDAFELIIERFKDSTEETLKEQVKEAKAILEQLNR